MRHYDWAGLREHQFVPPFDDKEMTISNSPPKGEGSTNI